MDKQEIIEVREQMKTIADSFNGYNGEIVLRGIHDRLEMSKAIDNHEYTHPVTGKVTSEEASNLLFIATKIFNGGKENVL